MKITSETIVKLRDLIDQIDTIRTLDWSNPIYGVWKGKVMRFVKTQFGEDSDYAKEIKHVLNPGIVVTTDTPDSYWVNLRRRTLDSARVHLGAYLQELEEFLNTKTVKEDESGAHVKKKRAEVQGPVKDLERIFFRFHTIVKSIAKRHDNRATLEVNDEYDVQDLLRSLMKMFFDDIRPEEWTPSYASKGAKMDFLLFKEEIIVECKMTRPGHGEKVISDELIVDSKRYKQHPKCKKLVCLIYDPLGIIDNKSALKDLEESSRGFTTQLYVIP